MQKPRKVETVVSDAQKKWRFAAFVGFIDVGPGGDEMPQNLGAVVANGAMEKPAEGRARSQQKKKVVDLVFRRAVLAKGFRYAEYGHWKESGNIGRRKETNLRSRSLP
jgi:hypothetical protein